MINYNNYNKPMLVMFIWAVISDDIILNNIIVFSNISE